MPLRTRKSVTVATGTAGLHLQFKVRLPYSITSPFLADVSAYRLVNPSGRLGGRICFNVSFSSNNFFISQPIHIILIHIVA